LVAYHVNDGFVVPSWRLLRQALQPLSEN